MDENSFLNEVRNALTNDNRRLGDVWRLTDEGKTAEEIAESLGVSSSGFVSTYRTYIRAIEQGVLPNSPTLAKQTSGALKSFVKRHDFSLEVRRVLEYRAGQCETRATNVQAIDEEVEEVEKQATDIAKMLVPGIYVYTYPHYLHHPVIEQNEDCDARTYFKVGMSTRDAFKRAVKQSTGMPEPVMILQVWVTESNDDLKEIEGKIQEHLRTIGHRNGRNKRREWFVTNEESVASIASLIGLKCHFDKRIEDTGE